MVSLFPSFDYGAQNVLKGTLMSIDLFCLYVPISERFVPLLGALNWVFLLPKHPTCGDLH